MASDEEVEDQRARVIELRARLDEAKTGGTETQKELENEIVLTQLQAEEARLQAELDIVKQNQNPKVIEQSVRAPLGTVREQMELAVAQQQATAAAITEANKNDPPTVVTPTNSPSAAPTPTETKADAPADTKKAQG